MESLPFKNEVDFRKTIRVGINFLTSKPYYNYD